MKFSDAQALVFMYCLYKHKLTRQGSFSVPYGDIGYGGTINLSECEFEAAIGWLIDNGLMVRVCPGRYELTDRGRAISDRTTLREDVAYMQDQFERLTGVQSTAPG